MENSIANGPVRKIVRIRSEDADNEMFAHKLVNKLIERGHDAREYAREMIINDATRRFKRQERGKKSFVKSHRAYLSDVKKIT